MKRHLSWMVLAFILFLRTAAFGQANLADVVTFGDSLTHNDMLGLFSGSPQDMYGADPMEAVFNKGAAPEDHLARYAIGGSQSDQITLQIGLYQVNRRFGRQDSATLFNLEIGGNDILDHIKLLASSAPGTNPSADAVINNLIENILKDLLYLRKIDQQAQFVLWTVPDVLLTPMLWDSFDSTEMDNIRAHTERVNRIIRGMDIYPSVVVFDLYAKMQVIISEPPMILGQQLVPPPTLGDYSCIFADELHPTAVINALCANLIIDAINEKWDDRIPSYTEEELADLAHIEY